MFNLDDINQSYIVVSPENNSRDQLENNILCERVCSVLYSKDYIIIPIHSYHLGKSSKSFIAVNTGQNTNDDLRSDSIYLIENFEVGEVIVKYNKDRQPTKINVDGSELPMSVKVYDPNLENKMYVYNGISFTINELKRYYFPKKESDIKKGMVVEYFNNNKWNRKKVDDPKSEYEKMYKLLIKYEKLRVEVV